MRIIGLFSVRSNGRVLLARNSPTIIGRNTLLNTFFGKAVPLTQINPWYIGLIGPGPNLSVTDTLSSHSGWTELTCYTGNRKAWIDSDAANGIKSTETESEFTITSPMQLAGLLLCSVASGTSGILWSTGLLENVENVDVGTVLKVSYTLQVKP